MAVTPFQLTELFSMDSFNSRIGEINTMFGGLGNEYLWEKALIQEVVKFGSSNDYQNSAYITPGNWPSSVGLRTYYSSGLPEIVLDNGVYKFKFTNSIPMYGGCDTSILSGKWISTYRGGSITTESWYIPDDGSLVWSGSNSNSNATCTITKGTLYKNPYYDVVKSSIEYVNSPDQNAYPPAVSDGYTYTALGRLGAKAQIATGIYAGTGTHGSSNPNSLTFEFEPGLVIISASGRPSIAFDSSWTQIALTKYFQTEFAVNRGFGYQIGNSGYGRKTNAGKTIEWYNTKSASDQMNNSGDIYYYVAIG